MVDMVKLWCVLVGYENETLWVNTLRYVILGSCKIVCHQSIVDETSAIDKANMMNADPRIIQCVGFQCLSRMGRNMQIQNKTK